MYIGKSTKWFRIHFKKINFIWIDQLYSNTKYVSLREDPYLFWAQSITKEITGEDCLQILCR